MMKKLCIKPFSAIFAWIVMSPVVNAAGLPQMEDPSRGKGNGIWQTIQNYAYDAVMLVALLVISCMFIGVCYHAYGVYSEVQNGKKNWGQFGLAVAVGAILLVIGIWLLTEGTSIL